MFDAKAYRKAYREANRETINALARARNSKEKRQEYIKKWRKDNAKKRKIQCKNWELKNKERAKEYRKVWREKNKDRIKHLNHLWYENNKRKCRSKDAKRRAAFLKRIPKWITKTELKDIENFYKNCPKGYHVDHIIPLQASVISGVHVLSNLQYLSAKENISKGNRYELDSI